jgi:hypothetical protein
LLIYFGYFLVLAAFRLVLLAFHQDHLHLDLQVHPVHHAIAQVRLVHHAIGQVRLVRQAIVQVLQDRQAPMALPMVDAAAAPSPTMVDEVVANPMAAAASPMAGEAAGIRHLEGKIPDSILSFEITPLSKSNLMHALAYVNTQWDV